MSFKPIIYYVPKQLIRRYFSDNISKSAAELSYFLLFSFAPLLMFLNSVIARLQISRASFNNFIAMLPSSVGDLVVGYFEYISEEPSLSPMIIGIVLTLFFMSRAMRSLMHTTSRIYRVKTKHNPVSKLLLSIFMTAGFLAAIVASFMLVIALKTTIRYAEQWLYIPESIYKLANGGNYCLMLIFVLMLMILFNKFVPNIKLTVKQVLPGAIFSTIGWAIISIGFSFYVDNMANYSVLYGSLGALIVLMLWLYLISQLMLIGSLLNHIIYQSKRYQNANNKYKFK